MPPLKFYRLKVTHHSEETDCAYCGSPIYVGEVAYFVEGEPVAVCSKLCKHELIKQCEEQNAYPY